MFTRKKCGIRMDLDPEYGSVNSARTFNVRRQENWPVRTLYNVNNEDVAAAHDKYDKQQQSFFDSVLPESNNSFFLEPSEALPPDRPLEVLKLIDTVPIIDFASLNLNKREPPPHVGVKQEPVTDDDIIELSSEEDDDNDDDDEDIQILGEVIVTPTKPTFLELREQRKLQKQMDKLTAFMKEKGIEETNTLEIEREKAEEDCLRREFLDEVEGLYMKVQEERMKTSFMLRPEETKYVLNLVDTPIRKKKGDKEKKQSTKEPISMRMRTPSPIYIQFSSDDDAPLIPKKTESKTKKPSPSAGPKRGPTYGKYARKPEDDAPKVAPPADFELFVPRKEPKLRSVNLNDYMRTTEAKQQKERLARLEKERREKDDQLSIIGVKKKNEAVTRVDPKQYPRTPRKEPPAPKSTEPSEPSRKKVRANPPNPSSLSEPQVDILGIITDAMDAHAAEAPAKVAVSSSENRKEEWVLPRYEEPIAPPSLPPRFGGHVDDLEESESMDISSPEASPRRPGEKTISPASSDEGIEVERRSRRDDGGSSMAGGDRAETFEDQLNMDNVDVGKESEAVADAAVDGEGQREEGGQSMAEYRFKELDYVKFAPAASSSSHPLLDLPKLIPCQKEGNTTDPRIPAPSPGALSRWQNTRVPINLDGHDAPIVLTMKKPELGTPTKKKKKGVKWGETATKEFDPDDDDEDGLIDVEKVEPEKEKINAEITGEKKVGDHVYKIVRKVPPPPPPPRVEPVPAKSCLKPLPNPLLNLQFTPGKGAVRPGIRPPTTPPLDEYDDESFPFPPFNSVITPQPPPLAIRIVPPTAFNAGISTPAKTAFNAGFVTPARTAFNAGFATPAKTALHAGFATPAKTAFNAVFATPAKKLSDFMPPPGYGVDREEEQRKEREKREKEDKERKEREEEERRKKSWDRSSSSSPEEIDVVSSSRNGGASSSISMSNTNPAMIPTLGGAAASLALNTMRAPVTRTYEKGSSIVGDRAPLPSYKLEEVKYQLEMREKLGDILKVHKTLKDDPEKEYPADERYPNSLEQHGEQDIGLDDLTPTEFHWKKSGIQPVWCQSLPYQAQFAFDRDAGLYWPVVQATDRISENEKDFESVDVLRSLGNNTHFATEKKTLLGIDARLPNGMTHKERFEAFFKGERPEGRFKNRRMHSRVFSHQSEEEARAIHNERLEEQRRLLKEHEETMKKNAPQGVSIARCEMTIDRPAGFKNFNSMIAEYKADDYENDRPFENADWYCNRMDYYMPYTERANYLCHVINHFNSDYNRLYDGPSFNKFEHMITLDKAAFAASQLSLARMEGWKRVGIEEEDYIRLLKRNKERTALIDSSSFSLDKYAELAVLDEAEQPFFHLIIDWLSSIFKTIKPISEWRLRDEIDAAFREVIMESDKKDRMGRPKDAREVFYESFKSSIPNPPTAKKAKWDG